MLITEHFFAKKNAHFTLLLPPAGKLAATKKTGTNFNTRRVKKTETNFPGRHTYTPTHLHPYILHNIYAPRARIQRRPGPASSPSPRKACRRPTRACPPQRGRAAARPAAAGRAPLRNPGGIRPGTDFGGRGEGRKHRGIFVRFFCFCGFNGNLTKTGETHKISQTLAAKKILKIALRKKPSKHLIFCTLMAFGPGPSNYDPRQLFLCGSTRSRNGDHTSKKYQGNTINVCPMSSCVGEGGYSWHTITVMSAAFVGLHIANFRRERNTNALNFTRQKSP